MYEIELRHNCKLFLWSMRRLRVVDPDNYFVAFVSERPVYHSRKTGEVINICMAMHEKRAAAIFLKRFRDNESWTKPPVYFCEL